MNDFLSVIRSAPLFSGIPEAELSAMLPCLSAEIKDFPKAIRQSRSALCCRERF